MTALKVNEAKQESGAKLTHSHHDTKTPHWQKPAMNTERIEQQLNNTYHIAHRKGKLDEHLTSFMPPDTRYTSTPRERKDVTSTSTFGLRTDGRAASISDIMPRVGLIRRKRSSSATSNFTPPFIALHSTW
jgi:hypothetical protein